MEPSNDESRKLVDQELELLHQIRDWVSATCGVAAPPLPACDASSTQAASVDQSQEVDMAQPGNEFKKQLDERLDLLYQISSIVVRNNRGADVTGPTSIMDSTYRRLAKKDDLVPDDWTKFFWKVVTEKYIDKRRSKERKRQRFTEMGNAFEEGCIDDADSTGERESLEIVLKYIAFLKDPELQQLEVLTHWVGLTQADIAAKMGITVGRLRTLRRQIEQRREVFARRNHE